MNYQVHKCYILIHFYVHFGNFSPKNDVFITHVFLVVRKVRPLNILNLFRQK